ncbi:hypothetical protein EXU48_17380 [Occultella glacieicola]|uniref:Uncharacterized protein n=1 Tax=Occultella glacieicola TaxID=2518684 RepID=A0ABY2E0E2_9MICO|nr:hypothetical protein [Occultella glacieicola]TDE90874.1 hypothetical protein EXU48_17380 [Occultella glacieicola]
MPRTTPVVIDHDPRAAGVPTASRIPVLLAGIGSLAVTALCLLFLARPGINQYTADNGVLATALLSPTAMTATLAALGGLGVLAAGSRLIGRSPAALTTAVGAVSAVVFGVLAQGTGTLSTFGYVVAWALPLVLITLWILAFRAYRGARPMLLVVAVALVIGGIVIRGALAGYVETMAPMLPGIQWTIASVVLPLLAAVAWGALLIRDARADGRGRRATAWVTRHRVLFTALAALGPLPYAVIRLTWLTPWPQFGGPVAELDPSVRVQGLMLGAAGWFGFVLTLGLIARWGERLPRWFPGGSGATDRPVHPLAAIIPGGLVALMLCGAAVPLLLMMGLQGALIFPAWFWGPMLGLAVWGYAGHRYGLGERASA